jgi:hypothetical protein
VSLLERAAADLVAIASDVEGGFSVPIKVTDPNQNTATINGLATDVGLTIDPGTGVAMPTQRASVALPIAKLTAAGLGEPKGLGDDKSRPWKVVFALPGKKERTFKVAMTLPDRALGCIVCLLEAYGA